ncbi:MAG: hypothetical protein PVI83_04445 [Lysobacterales bacterium]|jgi:hypothetical protein
MAAFLSLALLTFPLLAVPGSEAEARKHRYEPEDEMPESIEEVIQPFPEEPGDRDPQQEQTPGTDECAMPEGDLPIQETSQEAVRSLSCFTFRWFDSWWGDEEDYPEDEVSGWLTVGASWRDYDGLDPRLRFRVRAPLPNLDNRWDVILGRVDDEAFISDTESQDSTFYNPGLFPDQDDEWLLGLGKRRRHRAQGLDWSVGVRLRVPPEPYVKAAYFWNRRTGENSDFRFRQTVFWRSDEGFGTTSRGDQSWGINARNVLRWEGRVTFSEETEGGRWYAGQTWYRLLGDRNAFSVLAFGRGETDRDVALKDYGVEVIWRRSFTRDWIYLSMGPSITWPRNKPEDKRELNFGFGVWLEMEFGDWRY